MLTQHLLQFAATKSVIYPVLHEKEQSFHDHQHGDIADVNLVAALPQSQVFPTSLGFKTGGLGMAR
jgi:hypothetical protein